MAQVLPYVPFLIRSARTLGSGIWRSPKEPWFKGASFETQLDCLPTATRPCKWPALWHLHLQMGFATTEPWLALGWLSKADGGGEWILHWAIHLSVDKSALRINLSAKWPCRGAMWIFLARLEGEFLEGEFFRGRFLLEENRIRKIRPKNSGSKFGRPKFVSQNLAPKSVSEVQNLSN